MKFFTTCSLILFCCFSLQAQQDTVMDFTADSAFNARVVSRYHELLRHHDPVMYLSFPTIRAARERFVPLTDGEGLNGYWIEGSMHYRFIGYRGKYYSFPTLQRLRLTMDAGITSRLTKDYSSPLLPMNNVFGFGVDYLLSPLKNLADESGGISVWTTIQAHHYSNGNKDTFFIDSPFRRNNYMTGDFSTNYIKVMLFAADHSHNRNTLSAGVGYRGDVDLGGPFGRNAELYNYYGDHRVLGSIQFTKRSAPTTKITNDATPGRDFLRVKVRRYFMVRSELEYIVGHLQSLTEKPCRLGWRNYFTYMPSVTNEVGITLQTYYGRDYLNIRFDDVIIMGSIGLFVKIGNGV